ncbi:flp operon protein Flp1 [Actinobacillus equuli]|nr:flp operon protein Flp1 [Actinobacillus equuli]
MLSTLTTKAYIAVTEGIRNFKENQQGVTAIEYGLIAVAVAALIILCSIKTMALSKIYKRNLMV